MLLLISCWSDIIGVDYINEEANQHSMVCEKKGFCFEYAEIKDMHKWLEGITQRYFLVQKVSLFFSITIINWTSFWKCPLAVGDGGGGEGEDV